jgi:hypothetical protein
MAAIMSQMATARTLIQRRLAGLLKAPARSAAVRDVTAHVYGNRPRCGAFARSTGQPCEAHVWVRPDGTLAKRCRNHGGPSTGPKTQAGKDRAELARVVGYYRWLDKKNRIEAALGKSLARRLVAEHGAIPPAVLRALRARGAL